MMPLLLRHRYLLALMLRLAAVLGIACLPAGCFAALGAGTVAATDKTPIDHVYSLISGKDCSIVRQNRGLTYCAEDEHEPQVAVHCYRTIGEVSCYATPDPYPGHQREVVPKEIAIVDSNPPPAHTPPKTN